MLRLRRDSIDYGESWANDSYYEGPRGESRVCTDKACLCIFVFFFAFWMISSSFVFLKLRPLHMLDSENKYDNETSYAIRKFPFSFNSSEFETKGKNCNATAVSLGECPKESLSLKRYRSGLREFNAHEVEDKIICKNDTIKRDIDTLYKLKGSIAKGDFADWYLSSNPGEFAASGLCSIVGYWCPTDTSHKSLHKNGTETNYEDFRNELRKSKISIWNAVISSAALSLIFFFLWRFIPTIMGWVTLLSLIVILIYLICYYHMKTSSVIQNNFNLWGFNFSKMYLAYIISLYLTLFYVLFFLTTNRRKISLLGGITREATMAIMEVYSSLIYSAINALLRLLLLFWVLMVSFQMLAGLEPRNAAFGIGSECVCTGEYKYLRCGDPCEVDKFKKLCKNPKSNQVCQVGGCKMITPKNDSFHSTIYLQGFGFYWTYSCLTSAVSTMILAGAFAEWYWKSEKGGVNVFRSIWRVFRYHLGTAAFGSLIMPFVSLPRKIFSSIRNSLINTSKTSAARLFLYLFACCHCALEYALEYFSDHGYIMCAMHGTNWYVSARNGVHLLWRNLWAVTSIDGVAIFLIRTSQALITVGTTWSIWYFSFYEKEPITLYIPILFIFFLTLIISNIFFTTLCTAIETLFVCYLEDLERNDGSIGKPYFASEDLRDALEA